MSSLTTLSLTNPLLIGAVVLVVGLPVAWALGLGRYVTGVGGAKLRRSVELAVKSLWLHKLRSFLSVLGIIIGTSAVISLMAFGEGSMQDALADIKRQGATNIIVRSVKPPDDSATSQRSFVTTFGITHKELERFSTFGNVISRRVELRVLPSEARYLDRLVNARVIATVPEYAEVNKLTMVSGRFLVGEDEDPNAPDPEHAKERPIDIDAPPWADDEPPPDPNDNKHMENVCVLGSEVADRLFPFEDPMGKTVLMRSHFFKVIGVCKERTPSGGTGGSQAAEDYNRDVYIPFKTSFARFGRIISVRSSGSRVNERVDVSQVTLTVDAEVDSPGGRAKVQAVGDEIKRMLERDRPRRDWQVTVPLDRLEEAERAQNRFTNLLVLIASISLVVGGIGIMNIMLATVTERTREIGIRRALGAKRKDITMQFLVEAVVQTTVGGLCGVALGLGMVFTVPALWKLIAGTTLPAVVHVPSIFLSLGVSVGVGVLFGWYPARRASRLDPIEALRHD
jgi:putative ABC transport system permease protein